MSSRGHEAQDNHLSGKLTVLSLGLGTDLCLIDRCRRQGLLAQKNEGPEQSTHPWAILPSQLLSRIDSPIKLPGLLADGKRTGTPGRFWASYPSDCGEPQHQWLSCLMNQCDN